MIIDTHTHFYDATRPQGVPWPGPNDKIRYPRAMPEDFKALTQPLGDVDTIVVEASHWLEDNKWVLDLAKKKPMIVGYVGHLFPGTENFPKHLDRFTKNKFFRGIRVGGAKLIENIPDFEKLATRDLELDIICGPDALPDIGRVAERIPNLRIVINHVAGVKIDGKPPDSKWVQGIKAVAAHPYVFCKVSGLVENTSLKRVPSDMSFYKPTIDVLWDAFGEDRLVYGSNWPVSEVFANYDTVHRIVMEYFSEKGRKASEKFFSGNARMAYKWIERRAQR